MKTFCSWPGVNVVEETERGGGKGRRTLELNHQNYCRIQRNACVHLLYILIHCMRLISNRDILVTFTADLSFGIYCHFNTIEATTANECELCRTSYVALSHFQRTHIPNYRLVYFNTTLPYRTDQIREHGHICH